MNAPEKLGQIVLAAQALNSTEIMITSTLDQINPLLDWAMETNGVSEVHYEIMPMFRLNVRTLEYNGITIHFNVV